MVAAGRCGQDQHRRRCTVRWPRGEDAFRAGALGAPTLRLMARAVSLEVCRKRTFSLTRGAHSRQRRRERAGAPTPSLAHIVGGGRGGPCAPK